MLPPIPLSLAVQQNEVVHVIDPTRVLDLEQLRDVTMDDEVLMREILAALMDDTSAQIYKLESAVRESDSSGCARLAHYCKGACSNVGANAVAAVFVQIETDAKSLQFQKCSVSLTALAREMERLQTEITKF